MNTKLIIAKIIFIIGKIIVWTFYVGGGGLALFAIFYAISKDFHLSHKEFFIHFLQFIGGIITIFGLSFVSVWAEDTINEDKEKKRIYKNILKIK
jgi:hypothetical protein